MDCLGKCKQKALSSNADTKPPAKAEENAHAASSKEVNEARRNSLP